MSITAQLAAQWNRRGKSWKRSSKAWPLDIAISYQSQMKPRLYSATWKSSRQNEAKSWNLFCLLKRWISHLWMGSIYVTEIATRDSNELHYVNKKTLIEDVWEIVGQSSSWCQKISGQRMIRWWSREKIHTIKGVLEVNEAVVLPIFISLQF